MIAPLSRLVDWLSIQGNFMRMPSVEGHDLRLEAAVRFATGPEFIPVGVQSTQVEFDRDDSREFRFPAPFPNGVKANDFACGRIYRCPGDWQRKPALILLHAGGDFKGYHLRFPMIARRCNEAGINVATLISPGGFQRRRSHPSAANFPDYLKMVKTVSLAVAEVRELIGWLLSQGCSAVSVWGFSWGGWVAGLTACHESRLTCAILTVFRSRTNCFPRQRIIWRRVREQLERQQAAFEQLDRTPMNLMLAQPAIPKENVLLIAGAHDLKVPTETIEELWRVWKQPEIWRLPEGHVSCLRNAPILTNRVLHWLSSRPGESRCWT